jgi:hypothetical protein
MLCLLQLPLHLKTPSTARTKMIKSRRALHRRFSRETSPTTIETSTLHYSMADDSDELSTYMKVEYSLFVKSALMMLMPDIWLIFISYPVFLTSASKYTRLVTRVCVMFKKFPMTCWYLHFLAFPAKLSWSLQPHLTSALMETGPLRPFRSEPRRDYMPHRNHVPTANEVYGTFDHNSLRLAQLSTTSMLLTPQRIILVCTK